MASGLVPRYTAASLLNAPIVSDGEQGISVLVPSRLLMETRMSGADAVVTCTGDAAVLLLLPLMVLLALLPLSVCLFWIRDPGMVEVRSAELLLLLLLLSWE